MADEKIDWVTVELTRNMVNTKPERFQTFERDGVSKQYTSIMGPYDSSFLYPITGLKQYKDDPNRITFTLPKGTDIYLSIKNEDGTYDKKIVKIEELVEMYTQSRNEFLAEKEAQSGFVNVTVPTSWGRDFVGKDGKAYVNISVPLPIHDSNGNVIKNEKGYDVTGYYSFIVAKDNFRQSSRDEGMSYFGLFKHQKDDEQKPYEVKLTRSVSNGDGTYRDDVMYMESETLKTYVDAAVSKSNYLNNLTSVTVGEKMASERTYVDRNTHEEKKFWSVAVPVYDANTKETTYFRISLSDYMAHRKDNDRVVLNLPIKNKEGEAYSFKATVTAKNEAGAYVVVAERLMTSEEIVKLFKESHERYVAENSPEMPFVPDAPSEEKEQEAAKTPPQEDVPFLNDEMAQQYPIANARIHHGR
jgi:hypothetical protein